MVTHAEPPALHREEEALCSAIAQQVSRCIYTLMSQQSFIRDVTVSVLYSLVVRAHEGSVCGCKSVRLRRGFGPCRVCACVCACSKVNTNRTQQRTAQLVSSRCISCLARSELCKMTR